MNDIRPWRSIGERTLVDDRWLTLKAETCETAEGIRIDPYYVIHCRDWAAVVAFTAAEELILVRQYRHALRRVTLELPAGEIDPNEDVATAGIRELLEETGYVGIKAEIVHELSPNPARFANRLFAISVEGVSLGRKLETDQTEQTETVLWPLRDVGQLFVHPEFENSTQLAALTSVLWATGRIALKS